MKKSPTKLIILIFITLCLSSCSEPSKNYNLDKILLLPNLNDFANQYPNLVKEIIAGHFSQANSILENQAALILSSVDSTILPSVILDEIRSSLEKKLSNEELVVLLSWFESNLGKSIILAEEKALTPEGYQLIINNTEDVIANSQLFETAERLDELLSETEMLMKVQEITVIATYATLLTAIDYDQELDLDAYKSQLTEISSITKVWTKSIVTSTLAYTYSQVDDVSLTEYEAFLNEPIAKKFRDSVIAGIVIGCEKTLSNWANYFNENVNVREE